MIEIVVSGQQEESSQAEQADRRGFGHLRDLYGIEVSSAGCVAVVALNDHLIEQAAVEVHHTGAAFGDILAGWCVILECFNGGAAVAVICEHESKILESAGVGVSRNSGDATDTDGPITLSPFQDGDAAAGDGDPLGKTIVGAFFVERRRESAVIAAIDFVNANTEVDCNGAVGNINRSWKGDA